MNPKACTKFRKDRLRNATAAVLTDRQTQTDRQTDRQKRVNNDRSIGPVPWYSSRTDKNVQASFVICKTAKHSQIRINNINQLQTTA